MFRVLRYVRLWYIFTWFYVRTTLLSYDTYAQRRFLLGTMVSRGPNAGATKTASTKLSKQWQENIFNIHTLINQTAKLEFGIRALHWFLRPQTSASHLSIRRQALKMDSLTNEMRLSNRKIQCIDVRPIIILNGGKRLIVAFAPELALRSPSLPGIDSSAKRDFCACFLPSISHAPAGILRQVLSRPHTTFHGEWGHTLILWKGGGCFRLI